MVHTVWTIRYGSIERLSVKVIQLKVIEELQSISKMGVLCTCMLAYTCPNACSSTLGPSLNTDIDLDMNSETNSFSFILNRGKNTGKE